MGVFIGLPVDRMWNGRSDLQAGVKICHWRYLQFWLTLGNQNDPLLGPQFHPPVWSVGGPISLAPCVHILMCFCTYFCSILPEWQGS